MLPADRLPRVWTKWTAIVANTDDHNRRRTHWVAFFLDGNRNATYFDSYGIPPSDSRFLLRLRRNSATHTWNTTQLQGYFSQTCGHYCCVFLYFMARGYSLSQFLQLFSGNLDANDKLIVCLFRKIFSTKSNNVQTSFTERYIQYCTCKK